MTNRDAILNIAVNLGRIGKLALEKREKRIALFLIDNDQYIATLQENKINPPLQKTITSFLTDYKRMIGIQERDEAWAESMFTWQNILTHRSDL